MLRRFPFDEDEVRPGRLVGVGEVDDDAVVGPDGIRLEAELLADPGGQGEARGRGELAGDRQNRMTSNSTRLRIAVSSGRSPGSPTTRSWRPELARPSTLEVVTPKRLEETSDRHQPEPHRPGGLGRLAGWVKTHRASIAILVPVLVLVGMVIAVVQLA
jgi:hypothetical protein